MLDQLPLIAVAAFASAFVSALGGTGGTYILLIALTPIVGVKAVVPLIAVYAVGSNVSRVIIYRKSVDWKLVTQFTLASLPGVYLGAEILAWIPERLLMAMLGILILSAIPLRRMLKKMKFTPGPKMIVSMGFTFGLMSGAATGSGMLSIAALSSVGLTGAMLLGTDAVIGLINAVSRVSVYAALDLLTWELLIAGALMGIMTMPGTWIASRVVAKMGDGAHSKLIELVILGGGGWLLYKAIFYSPAAV